MNNKDMPAMPSESIEMVNCHGHTVWLTSNGLTKREMFAMYAVQGFLSSAVNELPEPHEAALFAVSQADALLAALENE